MTLRVTFLGTSGAVPTTERNPSGVFVNREGDRLLFDAGEGAQRQMMRFGTGFGVSHVFLTHLHGDHVLGLPGLIQTWSFTDRSDPLTIHTPAGTGARLREFLFAIEGRPPYRVEIQEVAPGEQIARFDEYEIHTVRTDHDTRAVGYVLIEDERKGRFDRERAEELGIPVGPKFSQLHSGESVKLEDGTVIESDQVVGPSRPGRKLVYTGDTRPTDAVVEAATEADLLIHDATFTSEREDRAQETAHSTAREAGKVAGRAGVRRLALTHISSRYPGDAAGHAEEAAEEFDGEIFVAEDGHEIDLPYSEG